MNNDLIQSQLEYQGTAGQRLAVRQISSPKDPNLVEETPPHVVFCGGFHSNMLGGKASELANLCAERQWSFTRFDYRGHGESDGAPEAFTLHDWLADTLSILETIERPVVLVGSSMGAWLATRAALEKPAQVKGLLLVAAAPDFLQELVQPKLGPAHIWDLQQDKVVELPNQYDQPFPITQALLNSGTELSLLSDSANTVHPGLESLGCPLRLLHGTADTDVPFDLSVRLMSKVSHKDARLTLLHQADHRLSDEISLKTICNELIGLVQTGFGLSH